MNNNMDSGSGASPAYKHALGQWDHIVLALNEHAIVSVADRAGNILYVNRMFCDISGYSEQELLGSNHRLIKSTYHKPEFYREMWRTITSGNSWKGEVCNRRKSGELYWVESTITPIFDDAGKPIQFVSIRTDITRQKQIEEDLKRQNRLEDFLARTASTLLATNASDIFPAIQETVQSCPKLWSAHFTAVLLNQTAEEDQPSGFFCCRDMPGNLLNDIRQQLQLETREEQISLPYSIIDNTGFADGSSEAAGCFLAVPLCAQSELVGFILFGTHQSPQDWWATFGRHTTLLADLIASAIYRYRTTSELFHSKERLRRGQIYANIGTWDWNIQTGDLFWSERIAPLFGYPGGELETTYENFLNAVHPEDRPLVEQAVQGAVYHNAPYEIEHRVVWPDGSIHWVLEKGAVNHDRDGKPLQMLGVVQDINERKKAQLALEEQQQELKRSQEIARLATMKVDAENKCFSFSDNIFDIFDLDRSSGPITPETIKQLIHPADVHIVDEVIQNLSERGNYDLSYRIVTPNGETKYINAIGEASRHLNGDISILSGAVQDITRRVELEKRIRDTEKRFVIAVEGAGDGVWDWDITGNRIECSQLMANMLGLSDQAFSIDFSDLVTLIHPDDHDACHQIAAKYIQGDSEGYSVQLRFDCHSAGYRWFLCRGTIVERDNDQSPIRAIGIVSDITEQKNTEQALINARNEAERANKAKSVFLSSMSHELRTPMNSILGFSQLMEMDQTLPEQSREYTSEIRKAGNHLLDLINEVLDLARVESGKTILNIEPIPVASLLFDVVALLTQNAESRHVSLDLSDVEEVAVMADRTRLKQIIINLVSNAIKYNREGGWVRIRTQTVNGKVNIAVEDTGIGIDDSKLKEVFQPFNRLGREFGDIEGTGIGLALTKKLTELMAGTVHVSSRAGEGSKFCIEFPSASPSQTCLPDEVIHRRASENALFDTPRCVLYIDDNCSNQKLVKNILEKIPNVCLISALDGRSGIHQATQSSPDLILVDINMPELDGYTVLMTLKSNPLFSDTPIVAVTANAMPSEIEKGIEAGFNEYLSKPFDVNAFRSIVCNLLHSS